MLSLGYAKGECLSLTTCAPRQTTQADQGEPNQTVGAGFGYRARHLRKELLHLAGRLDRTEIGNYAEIGIVAGSVVVKRLVAPKRRARREFGRAEELPDGCLNVAIL